MTRNFRWFAVLAMLGGVLPAAAGEITLESLLNESVDRAAVARFPNPAYVTRQASSYDRRSVAPNQPGWFANSDSGQYVRDEINGDRNEHVMLDVSGAGAITRFWITTSVKDPKSTIRVYLDGAAEPTLTFANYDLGASNVKFDAPWWAPHTSKRGSTLHVPIPFARHCKVTVQDGDGNRFYQINYRLYPEGTSVRTFTVAELESARTQLARVGAELLHPTADTSHRSAPDQGTLQSSAEKRFELPAGPAAVTELRVRLKSAGDLEQALRTTILKANFDGETTIWAPLGDFSGSGVGGRALRSWYRDVEPDGTIVARWVMPYRKSARLSLVNLGKQPVSYELQYVRSAWVWDERSMHFHANWRQEDLQFPPEQDWNMNTLTGKGVFVGDVLAVFNRERLWYGEGDEKIWTDGEAFPADFGTGTEDYYDASFAPVVPYQTPWANAPRADDPSSVGHNTFTRTRNLDAVPFNRSLRFDFEVLPWAKSRPTYAGTTYWYGLPGATSNIAPAPAQAVRPIGVAPPHVVFKRAGAIEFESMTVLSTTHGAVDSLDWSGMGEGQHWSGDRIALVKGDVPGSTVEFMIPAPDARAREILLYYGRSPYSGTYRLSVNDEPGAIEVASTTPEIHSEGPVSLGLHAPRDGHYVLKVELLRPRPGPANGSRPTDILAVLDCVVLADPQTPAH